jgi:hypothetical protein
LFNIFHPSPPEEKNNPTISKRLARHQKSRGHNLPPLNYCCCCSTFALTAFISFGLINIFCRSSPTHCLHRVP